MSRKISISILLCLLGFSSYAMNAGEIRISTQTAFNNMRVAIDKRVKAGEKQITVIVEPGIYEFNENHLALKNLDYHDIDLTISGQGVTVTSAGELIERGAALQKLNRYRCYLTDTGDELDPWSSFQQTDREIQVLDSKTGACRIHCVQPIRKCNAAQCEGQYILITESFKSIQCKVTSIKGGYIYFTADNTSDINFDYSVAKRFPRFKLLGNRDFHGNMYIADGTVRFPDGYKTVKSCRSSNFLYVEGCRFKSFRIDGLHFKGSKESSQLMAFTNNEAVGGIAVTNCEFRNIHGDVIMIRNTDDVTVKDCCFSETYRSGISSDNKSARTVVCGNRFVNCCTAPRYSVCVTCSGTDYRVSGNVFEDFGYCAISVGLHHDSKKYEPITGTVDRNEVYNTPAHNAAAFENSLMDSGAIYLAANHDATVVEYNNVHDIAGYYSNNGIYCDQGAKGFKLYGNVITHIATGYTIYSRRVAYIEKLASSQVKKTNVDNQIMNNILDGKYMFNGRPGDNNCVKGRNYLVRAADGSVPVLKMSDIPVVEDDVVLDNVTIADGKVKVSREDLGKYFSSREFDPVRQYLK